MGNENSAMLVNYSLCRGYIYSAEFGAEATARCMNPGNSWRTASARGMVVPYFMHNWRADSRGLPRMTYADTLQMLSGVTQPAGTCSSATCVSSGAIAGRGQRHRSLDHSSGRTLFTGSRSLPALEFLVGSVPAAAAGHRHRQFWSAGAPIG